ncbi:MAG: hypothetical protein M3446_04630 [Actinomycetota bacterium]|nr:hypothetical protein [Actinomycetota bacterium]
MATENAAQDEIAAWFTGRLPDDWFTGAAEITVDREEILVVGTLADPEVAADADDAARSSAAAGRISRWREQTREDRIGIAQSAEHRFERKVAWGATCGSTSTLFTHLAIPVMTRLRQPERRVLDTLVESGVARSRSEALSWSVRLVGQHTEDWLAELRTAMASVDEVRARGPQTG